MGSFTAFQNFYWSANSELTCTYWVFSIYPSVFYNISDSKQLKHKFIHKWKLLEIQKRICTKKNKSNKWRAAFWVMWTWESAGYQQERDWSLTGTKQNTLASATLSPQLGEGESSLCWDKGERILANFVSADAGNPTYWKASQSSHSCSPLM